MRTALTHEEIRRRKAVKADRVTSIANRLRSHAQRVAAIKRHARITRRAELPDVAKAHDYKKYGPPVSVTPTAAGEARSKEAEAAAVSLGDAGATAEEPGGPDAAGDVGVPVVRESRLVAAHVAWADLPPVTA